MASTFGTKLLYLFIGALVGVACTSSPPTPTPTWTPTPVPTVTPTPAPTPAPTAEPTTTPTPQLAALFYYSRAVRLLEVAEYDQAIAAFGIVIRRLPDFALAYRGRGLAYYHKGRLGPAREDFQRAVELKPDFADAYVDLAVLLTDQGDTAAAVADLEKALTLYDAVLDAEKIERVRILLAKLKR